MRVNTNSLLAVLVGFTLNLGLSGVAQADLPAATAFAQVFYGQFVSPGASEELMDTTWSFSDAYGSSVVATAMSGPLPSLSVTAHSGSDPSRPWYVAQPSIQVTGFLEYSFLVNGPNPGTAVPINISGIYRLGDSTVASAEFQSQASAQVSASILTDGLSVLYSFGKGCNSAASNPADQICGDSSFAGTVNMYSGNSGKIRLNTTVGAGSARNPFSLNGFLSADASAYIDPYIEIDPTWALANPGYSISVSPGVGNTAPVPEAETYAMMLAGLGLVGFVARRRKQVEA